MDYQDIVSAELIAHDITLCAGCGNGMSHSRGFAVPDSRTIHYAARMATRGTLYGFLHEVGHIVRGHGKASKLRRFEQEDEAETYARESFRAYGIAVPREKVALGNAYVRRWKRFGDRVRSGRRGGR
jgi:hypothetical protein